jgi:flavin-binding protein dodecin
MSGVSVRKAATGGRTCLENDMADNAKSLRNLEWFQVTEIRGHIDSGKVAHYQVAMKLGLRYEPR